MDLEVPRSSRGGGTIFQSIQPIFPTAMGLRRGILGFHADIAIGIPDINNLDTLQSASTHSQLSIYLMIYSELNYSIQDSRLINF